MFVITYLDNILVYLLNKEEHIKHIIKVLTAIEKAKL